MHLRESCLEHRAVCTRDWCVCVCTDEFCWSLGSKTSTNNSADDLFACVQDASIANACNVGCEHFDSFDYPTLPRPCFPRFSKTTSKTPAKTMISPCFWRLSKALASCILSADNIRLEQNSAGPSSKSEQSLCVTFA